MIDRRRHRVARAVEPGSVVVLDQSLRADNGHHGTFARLLIAETRRRSWPITLVGHAELRPPLDRLGIVPHFRATAYDGLLPAGAAAPAERRAATLDRLDRIVEEDLERLDPRPLGAARLLLVPTVTAAGVAGVARWIERHAAHLPPRIALGLLLPPDGLDGPGSVELDAYRRAFDRLASVGDDRLRPFAESEAIARAFESHVDRPVTRVTWPTPVRRATPDGPRPVVGYLGYAGPERGVHLLPAIARAVLERHPGARLDVQINTYLPGTVRRVLEELDALAPAVELHRGPRSHRGYLRALRTASIVLLPYDPPAYARRGSTLLVDAAAAGRPVVLPAGTWLAEHARASGLAAVEFDRFDAGSIAEATAGAIDRRTALAATAMDRAADWRAAHDTAALLEALLDDRPDPRPPRAGSAGVRPVAGAAP